MKCAYCNWVGQEPEVAAFTDQAAYEAAYDAYVASHDDPGQNVCPTQSDSFPVPDRPATWYSHIYPKEGANQVRKEKTEPWQMTREKYGASQEYEKHFGTNLLRERQKIAADRHWNLTRKAMREGKPVPPEVLKEYPDLTPAPELSPSLSS